MTRRCCLGPKIILWIKQSTNHRDIHISDYLPVFRGIFWKVGSGINKSSSGLPYVQNRYLSTGGTWRYSARGIGAKLRGFSSAFPGAPPPTPRCRGPPPLPRQWCCCCCCSPRTGRWGWCRCPRWPSCTPVSDGRLPLWGPAVVQRPFLPMSQRFFAKKKMQHFLFHTKKFFFSQCWGPGFFYLNPGSGFFHPESEFATMNWQRIKKGMFNPKNCY